MPCCSAGPLRKNRTGPDDTGASGHSHRYLEPDPHAYVRTAQRNKGIGGKLLCELRTPTSRPVLIGTWAVATWAIRFYQKHGFRLVTPEEKNRLLKKYWSIPERQVETSVVLADELASYKPSP